MAIELDDGDVRVVRRTTTQPVRSIKGRRPRTATNDHLTGKIELPGPES